MVTNILTAYIYGDIIYFRQITTLTIIAAKIVHYLTNGDCPDFVASVAGANKHCLDRALSFAHGMATVEGERNDSDQ